MNVSRSDLRYHAAGMAGELAWPMLWSGLIVGGFMAFRHALVTELPTAPADAPATEQAAIGLLAALDLASALVIFFAFLTPGLLCLRVKRRFESNHTRRWSHGGSSRESRLSDVQWLTLGSVTVTVAGWFMGGWMARLSAERGFTYMVGFAWFMQGFAVLAGVVGLCIAGWVWLKAGESE